MTDRHERPDHEGCAAVSHGHTRRTAMQRWIRVLIVLRAGRRCSPRAATIRSTPTAPTPPPTVTETFSGTVSRNGAVTHNFTTAGQRHGHRDADDACPGQRAARRPEPRDLERHGVSAGDHQGRMRRRARSSRAASRRSAACACGSTTWATSWTRSPTRSRSCIRERTSDGAG